ncbi:hypothetical protein OTU49_016527 [Cherax quadricarinatus]|uniref:G-protein coupled receptors family 1 profile domain-containing protein n=1 Tax=Cherax quadricarinatus TaxID=27406 RepID=A0AAW0XSY2_CHEQU
MFNHSSNNNTCNIYFIDDDAPEWLCWVRLLMSLVLVAESVLTVYVISSSVKMRKKSSTILVTNLALSGGLCGALVALFTLVKLTYLPEPHSLPQHFCIIIIPRYFHIVSVLCLSCLALDRYLAICWPLHYHSLMTDNQCKALGMSCWILPVLALIILILRAAFIHCFSAFPFLTTYIIAFSIALSIVVFMYALMAREFRLNRHQGPHVNKAMEEDNRRLREKTARDVLVMVFLNLLLALPDVIVKLVWVITKRTPNLSYHISPLLLFLHELVCLPLLAWRNADFRHALNSCCCASRKNASERGASQVTLDSQLSKQ